MLVEIGHEMANFLVGSNSWPDSLDFLIGSSSIHWSVLAQTFDDVDILADLQKAFSGFIESGQVWALLIGLIIGYFLKGITK